MQKNLEEIPLSDFFDQQDMDLAASAFVDSLEERGTITSRTVVEEIQDPEQRRTALTDCANPLVTVMVLPTGSGKAGLCFLGCR